MSDERPGDEPAEDEEDEMTRVTIRLKESKKESWEEFVDDPRTEYMNLSHLIRDCVQMEIYATRGEDGEPADSVPAADVNLDAVEDDLDDIKGQLDDLSSDVGQVQSLSALAMDMMGGSMDDISSDVFSVLPEVSSDQEMWTRIDDSDLSQFDSGDAARATEFGCVNDIVAHFTAYDRQTVENAVNSLVSDVQTVSQYSEDGHLFVYEVV